ncbi:uncharacterized protein EV420DRAFT_1650067 [Desarmillaria tabescens]|uniref:CCHC-type domain-containing protein n=1 Tax=Armillaria tabescens TaxID=1929756 RepID=A0AA39MPY7_ARMTA|nr:uncharacterized protein EV420DRAFT_1650067 [Desarmillaria tabescens]KAK0441470.1 hypothetical protein EV420DRAFT_1650067 [Desarmillaria tabescens]
MASKTASEGSAAMQQQPVQSESQHTSEVPQQLPSSLPPVEHASSPPAMALAPASTTRDADSGLPTLAPAPTVHSNVLYRPSGIITMPEGTPASKTSVIGHLCPAMFSDSRSPARSIAPSLRAMGAYDQSPGSAPPAYTNGIPDGFHFPQVSPHHPASEQLPELSPPVTSLLMSHNSPSAETQGETMPSLFPESPEATTEDVNRFIEERVHIAARCYEDGLLSISMQRQTVNGTIFHGIPRLAINKFFATNLNASGHFNPIPTDVRPKLGDYHHSIDEYSMNINAAVNNLSLPQQKGIRISVPHIHSEVYHPLRARFPPPENSSWPLPGLNTTHVPARDHPSVSRASSQTIVDCIEEQNKALICKLKGEFDSDADDEDEASPTARRERYAPPHCRPTPQHPKVEDSDSFHQSGVGNLHNQSARPVPVSRPCSHIASHETRPQRPVHAPEQPTRVRAAAPDPNPGDDGSSSDSHGSAPDPPNSPHILHPGLPPLPSRRPAMSACPQPDNYDLREPASYFESGAGRPPNDPPHLPPPGGPGSHHSGSSSQHSSHSDNPRAHELTPAHFQEVRFTSQEPHFNNEEIFEYLPVMRTEVEIMLAIFQCYECLVNHNLLHAQRGLDSNVQKTSLQSIPHPQKYEGDSDLIEFNEWIFSIIRWMKITNICGPVYTDNEWGGQQLSAIDMQHMSTLATFLGGDAHMWYNNVVEDAPATYANNDNGDDFPTFMEENAKAAKKKHSPSPCKFKKVQGEHHSTQPNPGYEKFKHICDQPKKDRPSSGHRSSYPSHSKDKGRSKSKILTCYACGKEGHYSNDPSCPDYGKRNSGVKIFHIVDDNSPTNSASDHESSEEESHSDVGNPPDWTHFSEDEPGSSSGHQSANISETEDPYGGSQYTTDEGTADKHMGFIFNEFNDETDAIDSSGPSDHECNSRAYNSTSKDSSSNLDVDSDRMESHDEYTLDFPEYLWAIQTDHASDGKINGYRLTLEPTKIHVPQTASHPKHTAVDNHCLAALVTINGCEAFTLFDSGSMADAISPNFTCLSKLSIFQLCNEHADGNPTSTQSNKPQPGILRIPIPSFYFIFHFIFHFSILIYQ